MLHGVALRPTDSMLPPGELARLVEERGFESLWFAGDGTATTLWDDPVVDGYDPFVALTFAAMTTSSLRLGAVIDLDARDVIIFAKEAASLDRLSGGRLELGLHGSDSERAREFVLALQALWRDEEPTFRGAHIAFDPVWSYPKPLQQPGPPIFVTAALAALAPLVAGVLSPVRGVAATEAHTVFVPADVAMVPAAVTRHVHVLPEGSTAALDAAVRRRGGFD